MVISEQQLFDYMKCPALYDFKYNKSIRIYEQVSIPKLLSGIANYFYFSIMNGKVPTSNDLKRKWDSVCTNNADYIDAKKNIEGMGSIINMFRWAQDERLIVADINSAYRLTFIHENKPVELVGSMGTILLTANNKYELLVTDFSSKLPDQTLIDMKLKYSLDCLAFSKTYNKEISGVRVHNIKNNKDFYSSRFDDDLKRFESSLINVVKSIRENIYYPRESTLCGPCAVKEYCKVWGSQTC